MNLADIHTDCCYFQTDRPCGPHKSTGVTCGACNNYDRVATKVLIVKLDAIGDVLRTTCILKAIKQKYPHSWVTWLTKNASLPLLDNNPYVVEVQAIEHHGLFLLMTTSFDVVINPDASSEASHYATLAKGREKFGFVFSEDGRLQPLNTSAEAWYLMGLNDEKKKQNTQTYQRIILDICELPTTDHPIIWAMNNEEFNYADQFALRHKIHQNGAPVIGLNTGAGGRWKWKKWTVLGYMALIEKILERIPNATILLYRGPDEQERNHELCINDRGRVIDTGHDNSLREFGALVSLCDVMVTGDTMAMHLATALGKRIVALFGPTSADEIELYGRGVKVQPKELSCLCCYLSDCEVKPACMEQISPSTVFEAVEGQCRLVHKISKLDMVA